MVLYPDRPRGKRMKLLVQSVGVLHMATCAICGAVHIRSVSCVCVCLQATSSEPRDCFHLKGWGCGSPFLGSRLSPAPAFCHLQHCHIPQSSIAGALHTHGANREVSTVILPLGGTKRKKPESQYFEIESIFCKIFGH